MGFESRLYVLEPVTVQVFLLIGKIYFMVVVVVVVVLMHLYMVLFCSLSDGSYPATLLSLLVLILVTLWSFYGFI